MREGGFGSTPEIFYRSKNALNVVFVHVKRGSHMFTGLVDHTAKILSIDKADDTATIGLSTQFKDLNLGDSIAIDGMCVTVVAIKNNTFSFQLSSESLTRSTAKNYRVGQLVNLERPLQYRGHLDGHLVTGHVDQVMQCAFVDVQNKFVVLTFSQVKPENLGYLTEKGSVAINGVSLTVNAVLDDGFSVMLIPHTLQKTNLSELKVGDRVNIEFDQLAKLVARQMQCHLNTLTKESQNA